MSEIKKIKFDDLQLKDIIINNKSNYKSKVNTENSSEVISFNTMSEDDMTHINIPDNDWIFGQEAIEHKQFGGDQGALIANLDYWLSNEKAINIIRSYYPEATLEDIEILYNNINEHGCGYIAAINTLFFQYIHTNVHSESDFYDRFGFRPYELVTDDNGTTYKDFNYELLVLDFYLYYAKHISYVDKDGYHTGYNTIQEANENMGGTFCDDVGEMFKQYLNTKQVNLEIIKGELMSEEEAKAHCEELHIDYNPNQDYYKPLTTDIIEKYCSSTSYNIVIGASEATWVDGIHTSRFDLYYPYDKDGNGKLDDLAISFDRDSAHAMTVVGTTSDPNKIVVSSWGEEYLVDLSQVGTSYTIYDYTGFNGF